MAMASPMPGDLPTGSGGVGLGTRKEFESTGDRTKLGRISKRGNKYLRTLFVQAAHVVIERRPAAAMRALWPWIHQASKRLAHRNLLAIALANKLARIAWAVLAWPRLRAKDHAQCRITSARSGSPREWLHLTPDD
jgi:transposase